MTNKLKIKCKICRHNEWKQIGMHTMCKKCGHILTDTEIEVYLRFCKNG